MEISNIQSQTIVQDSENEGWWCVHFVAACRALFAYTRYSASMYGVGFINWPDPSLYFHGCEKFKRFFLLFCVLYSNQMCDTTYMFVFKGTRLIQIPIY